MAAVTQTTALRLLAESWETDFEYAANNVRGLTKVIEDTGDKYMGPGGYKVHIPIVGAIAASAYSGTVTATANTETEAVGTPSAVYAAVDLQEDVLNTTAIPATQAYAPAVAESVYQKIDVDGLSLYASFTSTDITDAGDFTETSFQTVISSILNAGGDKVALGQLTGFYHPLKWKIVMQLGNFNSAAVRGDGAGPAKTGVLGMAYGVNMIFTKNVQTSVTLRNLVLAKKAMILIRKNKAKLEMERRLGTLSTMMVGSVMYAIIALHQVAGGMHRITTTT